MDTQEFFNEVLEDQEALFDAGLCDGVELDDRHTIQLFKEGGQWIGILTRKVDGFIYQGELVSIDSIPVWDESVMIDGDLIIVTRFPPGVSLPDSKVMSKFGPAEFSWQIADAARNWLNDN